MATNKHTYLRENKISGALMTFDVRADEAALREKAMTSKAGRAAKTIVKEGRLRLTVIAMRKGVVLSEHSVDGAVTVQTLRGRVRLSAGGRDAVLATGAIAAIDVNVTHSVTALADSAILVTVAMEAE